MSDFDLIPLIPRHDGESSPVPGEPALDLIIDSAGRGESQRADAQKNRRLLLETAQRLFAAHDPAIVTMSQVADAAGVGKGTLYRHFPSKTALCQQLIDTDQRVMQERTFARLHEGGDPRTGLRWFLLEALGFVERNLPLLGAEAGQCMLHHPAHQWWWQTMYALLGQMKPPPRVSARSSADALYILLDAHAIRFQLEAGRTPEYMRAGIVGVADALMG